MLYDVSHIRAFLNVVCLWW